MEQQLSFADSEYRLKRHQTRKDEFLARMEQLVPWQRFEAPNLTKNKAGERDPEMHQTKKCNQWYFGMKANIGVDAKSGLTHSFATTAANEHDLNQADKRLHGDEKSTPSQMQVIAV